MHLAWDEARLKVAWRTSIETGAETLTGLWPLWLWLELGMQHKL